MNIYRILIITCKRIFTLILKWIFYYKSGQFQNLNKSLNVRNLIPDTTIIVG